MDTLLDDLAEEFFSNIDSGTSERETVVKVAKAYYNRSQGLKLEIDALQVTIKHLESENERLRNELLCASGAATAPLDESLHEGTSEVDQTVRPKTVGQAVKHACLTLKKLRFLPTAVESAGKSQFRRPEEVFEMLALLDECARERSKGSLKTDVATWLQRRGVDFAARESERVDAQFRLERIFYDQNKEDFVYMPAHVKMGRGELRIHLDWQDDEGKWLIGYIGPHLRTARYN